MSFLSRISAGFKSLARGELRFPHRTFVFFDLADKPVLDDMAKEVGDGTSSDVLMSCVRWIQRAIVEAPMTAVDRDGAPKPDSPLQGLLDNPNPFYSGDLLLQAAALDLTTSGNSYWLIVESGNSQPAELWWAPSHTMEPRWPDEDPTVFISHYDYRPEGGGEPTKLEPKDVLHFRMGADPRNIRKGLSPLRGLLREIWTDNEAAQFTAALLRNGGIAGMVVSPSEAGVEITKQEREAAEAKLETKFSGEGRGRTLVLSGRVTVDQFGFSPQQMDLSALRNVAEERVTATLGVAAAVVGFGSGLQQTKVGATMRELVQLSYHNGVIPLQRIIAQELTRGLPERMRGGVAVRVIFDLDQVQALREDQDARAGRMERLVRAGVFTRGEARLELGLESGPADDVYLLPISTIEVSRSRRPRPQLVEVRARLLPFQTKDHTLLEERIAERPSHRTLPAAVVSFANAIDRIRRSAALIFADLVEPVFRRLGAEAQRVARGVLAETRSASAGQSKQDSQTLEIILDQINFAVLDEELRAAYVEAYGQISGEAAEALGILGVDIALPDSVQLEILRAGGVRAGLIDLTADTRDALFRALAEGRERGLAGDNLARLIRENIEAGPWRSVETRALVIARTEGAFAANQSVIEAARAMDGVEMMMMHDNRTGFDDDICPQIDGVPVTIDEAEALMADEHPNGTRSATPLPPLLAEELGL